MGRKLQWHQTPDTDNTPVLIEFKNRITFKGLQDVFGYLKPNKKYLFKFKRVTGFHDTEVVNLLAWHVHFNPKVESIYIVNSDLPLLGCVSLMRALAKANWSKNLLIKCRGYEVGIDFSRFYWRLPDNIDLSKTFYAKDFSVDVDKKLHGIFRSYKGGWDKFRLQMAPSRLFVNGFFRHPHAASTSEQHQHRQRIVRFRPHL